MTLAYAAKLGPASQNINVGTERIDVSALVIFGIVIAGILLPDKLGRV